MEAVSTLVKDDVGQTVSVAAPVASLVTSSRAPVPVSASGPSSSVSLWVTPVVGLLLNVIWTVNTPRLEAKVLRFCSLAVTSCVSSVMVHGIYKLMGVSWYSFMCLLAKPVSSCAMRPDELLAASWLILTAIWSCLALLSRLVPLLCRLWFTLVARIVWSSSVTFADTGVLVNFENVYHEAMALNSSLLVRGVT